MTFEEDFPSLKGDRLDDIKPAQIVDWRYNKDGLFVQIGAVKEHCLDKKRVKEAIGKILDHSSDCQGITNCDKCYLLEELGYNKK